MVDPNGKLKIGQSYNNNTILVYTDSESRIEGLESRPYVQTIEMTPEEVSGNIVDPILNYMTSMSNQLLSYKPTVTPTKIENQIIIDAADFDDNTTIYVDGDALYREYGSDLTSADRLLIKKKEGQTIVFNFAEKTDFSINQYAVELTKSDGTVIRGNSKPDTSHAEGADHQNVLLDNLARHIVWNLHSAQRVHFKSPAGIFLIPNPNSYAITDGTTTGWLVTAGYFTTGSGEWHYVYADLTGVDSANLYAYKSINNKDAASDQVFEFKLEKYDGSDFTEVPEISPVQNNGALVSFHIENSQSEGDGGLDDGWNVYRITETGIVDAYGTFEPNTQEYYAATSIHDHWKNHSLD